MTWKMSAVLIGATMAVGIGTPRGGADDEPVVTGHQKFVPWKLGVTGADTDDGYVTQSVVQGYPANRLGPDHGFTLDPGDRITEVNGRSLNRSWTLQKALGYSTGRIDFRYWDDRTREFVMYRGVTLVR